MTDNIDFTTNTTEIENKAMSSGLVFKTKDVLGNTIVLKNTTLQNHIAGESGDHPERHYLNFDSNISRVKKIIEDPTQILSDKSMKNRYNYIATTSFESQTSVKGVKIVTEEIGTNHHEVVTIYSTKQIRESTEGRVLYDRYSSEI